MRSTCLHYENDSLIHSHNLSNIKFIHSLQNDIDAVGTNICDAYL